MRRLAVGLAALAATACSPPAPAAVPVQEEPHHRMVSETAFAQVLDIRILGGDTTLVHVHSRPMAYACISGSALKTQVRGAGWTPAGEPCAVGTGGVTTTYAARPEAHRVANVGLDGFRIIGVQSLRDPETGDWFDLRTVMLGLAAEDAAHRHDVPTLVVLAAGAAVNRVVGGRETLLLDPGTWVWIEAGSSHSLINETGPEARLVEIAVR